MSKKFDYDGTKKLLDSLRLDYLTTKQLKSLRETFFKLAVDMYNAHLLVEGMQRTLEGRLADRGVDWAIAICRYEKDIEEQRRRRDEQHPVYY